MKKKARDEALSHYKEKYNELIEKYAAQGLELRRLKSILNGDKKAEHTQPYCTTVECSVCKYSHRVADGDGGYAFKCFAHVGCKDFEMRQD